MSVNSKAYLKSSCQNRTDQSNWTSFTFGVQPRQIQPVLATRSRSRTLFFSMKNKENTKRRRFSLETPQITETLRFVTFITLSLCLESLTKHKPEPPNPLISVLSSRRRPPRLWCLDSRTRRRSSHCTELFLRRAAALVASGGFPRRSTPFSGLRNFVFQVLVSISCFLVSISCLLFL